MAQLPVLLPCKPYCLQELLSINTSPVSLQRSISCLLLQTSFGSLCILIEPDDPTGFAIWPHPSSGVMLGRSYPDIPCGPDYVRDGIQGPPTGGIDTTVEPHSSLEYLLSSSESLPWIIQPSSPCLGLSWASYCCKGSWKLDCSESGIGGGVTVP